MGTGAGSRIGAAPPLCLRKRDELVAPWNPLEASLAPANLGFLQDLARARHEVPPDQALAVRFSPADQHQAGARQRLYFHGLAIRQDRHMLRRKRDRKSVV